MKFFNKKKIKVDLDAVFKEKYKDLNQTMMDANNELDMEIKVSQLYLVIEKYNDLLDLIDQGANFEKDHFIKLKQGVERQLELSKEVE